VRHADLHSGIAEEEPRARLVMGDHLGDPVGPTSEEPGREPGFERLYRSARLEPGHAIVDRHAEDRGPRAFVHRFDRAGGL